MVIRVLPDGARTTAPRRPCLKSYCFFISFPRTGVAHVASPFSGAPSSGEVTGHEPAPDGAERRLLGGAHLPGERAARPEPAAAGNIVRVRRLTLQRELERHAPAADARDRGQERLRVGVARLL